MKIKLFCLLTLIFLLSPLYVSAEDKSDFTVKLGADFTSVYEDSNKSEAARLLGMSEDELDEYFDDNDVLMVAVNKNNSFQVRLSSYENDFSELAEDMTLLDDKEILELTPYLVGEQENPQIRESNGRKYISFSETHKDSGGAYTATQFITVCDGEVYQFSCFNSGETAEPQVFDIFSTLIIKDGNSNHHSTPIWATLLIVLGIAIFAAIAVAMIIGIIKEKRKKPQGENS